MKIICDVCKSIEHRVYITGLWSKHPVMYIYCANCQQILTVLDSRPKWRRKRSPTNISTSLDTIKDDNYKSVGILTPALVQEDNKQS